ncbi:resolvase protein, partial [Escherichia coli EC1849]
SIWHCSGRPEERNANSWSTFSQTNVYENAEITSKWHHSCFCQGDLPCLLAMYVCQQMTRTQIYNVMR